MQKPGADFQLIQSRESLEFALQSGRMGTWDINLANDTVSCSREMLNLWNVSEKDFNNQRSILQRKVHPDDLQMMVDAINYAIENRTIYELEYRIIPQKGTVRWMSSRGRCTFAPDSNEPIRFAGIVYDITDRRKREEELAAATKARDHFFTIASHELKTPLTCLQLQLQVMQWELKQISSASFAIDSLETGLKKQQEHLLRISRIVDNILDESKISDGRLALQLEKFDLSEMVTEVLEQIKVTALLSGIEIRFNFSQSIHGNWDRFRLEQVLMNLLMNAIRYGDNKPIHVDVKKNDTQVFIIVRDEGIGIRPEDQTRIFQRFERANPEIVVNGMGLGLYISDSIVRAHHGEIRLKSEVGKGSEFSVILPYS